ncbi:MAG: uncharacterized protein K0S37_750 [Microbacterium sp.]|jgi:hypothetical protein|nr:uncharacterized protein [Microbacterium sp.]
MDQHPVSSRRRRIYEAAIRIVDLVSYAIVFATGIYAVIATPATVQTELRHFPVLIFTWAFLLLAGGMVGFVGRLTRYWMVENSAAIAAFTGIAIYMILLGGSAVSSTTAAVATGMVVIAGLGMARRWLELQIFGIEPNLTMRQRVAVAMRRRTADVVPRDS